ncbi:MAG: hypothetical protein ACI9E4_000708, partial [Pseudohongiellaceae bacterium]
MGARTLNQHKDKGVNLSCTETFVQPAGVCIQARYRKGINLAA